MEGMLEPKRRHFFAVTSAIVLACSLVACASPGTGQNDAYETAKPKKKVPAEEAPPKPLPPPPKTDAGSVDLPVEPPVPPLVSAVEPSTFVATPNPQPFKVRLTGSGFSQGASVRLDDKPVAAVFANSSSVTVTVPVENLKQAGIINFTVVTATSPPLKSSPVAFTVTAAVPTPPPGTPPPTPPTPPPPITLTTLTPNSAIAGQVATNLTVSGANFTNASTVRFNGIALATTVTNAVTVSTQIPATQLATAGTFNVTVVDAAQAPSNTLTFTVTPKVVTPTPNPTPPTPTPDAGAPTPPAPVCKVTCATAGVKATGCIAKGTYAGGYCAKDGCAYDGAAYGCSVYLPDVPSPTGVCAVNCSVAKMTAPGCVSSGGYAGAYCSSDKCLYQGASYGCGIFSGSTSGDEFPKKCKAASGTYTGTACSARATASS